MTNKLSILLLAVVFLASCSNSKPSTEETSEEVVEETVAETPAVCVWDGISLRQDPDPKSKYLTSISLGESLTYLGVDSTMGDKTYAQVRLNDGKEGWALKTLIAENGKAAVFVGESNLYSRPDLLTQTDKVFAAMDIVASLEAEGDWVKITGKRSGAKWISDGWVKTDNISYEAIDIATAKFAQKALAEENKDDKIKALQQLIDNKDLSGSQFMSQLVVDLTALTEETTEMDGESEATEMMEEADSIQ